MRHSSTAKGLAPGVARRVALWSFPALVLVLLTDACATRTELVTTASLRAEECGLFPDGDEADTVTIALTERVDPTHARWPQNDSERLLFRHFYETLIRVDCRGRAYPGLAESVRADEGGRRWIFSLRANARYWDGSAVTASAIVSGWLSDETSARHLRAAGISLRSVTAINDRTLSVALNDRHASLPHLFADPVLAVAKPDSSSRWPQGTGPYQVVPHAHGTGESLSEHFSTAYPVTSKSEVHRPVVRFQLAYGVDPRDVLDGGVDLLVTSDRAVMAYAARRVQLALVRLPWQRTYALLSPGWVRRASMAILEAESLGTMVPLGFREALARDAVRAEARGARSPFWWEDMAGCRVSVQSAAASRAVSGAGSESGRRRIVYNRDDPTARDLAERMVALIGSAGSDLQPSDALSFFRFEFFEGDARLVAAGLGPEEFAAALDAGDESAYILALPRRALDRCQQVQALVSAADWLAAGAAGELGLSLVLAPLVDTRSRAIVRRGLSGLVASWDGTVFLGGADWARGER